MRLLHRGNKERTQEATAANKTSSRSHALLIVNVKQTAKVRGLAARGGAKTGRLYMIDLAGSERAAQTQVAPNFVKYSTQFLISLLVLKYF
jgi:kinesin family protein 18/19